MPCKVTCSQVPGIRTTWGGGIVLPTYHQRKEEIPCLCFMSGDPRYQHGLVLLFLEVKMPVKIALFSYLWCLDKHCLGSINIFLYETLLKHLKVKFCSRIKVIIEKNITQADFKIKLGHLLTVKCRC